MSLFTDILRDDHARATMLLLGLREIRGRFIGTYLGFGHYVLLPLVMLLVYAFVFGVVLNIRWPGATADLGDFALRLFAGLIAFQFFAEVVSRAPSLVVANPTYVSKVVFPLQTLVPSALLSALFGAFWATLILIAGYVATRGAPPLTALWLPLWWLPLILVTAGVGWALAALGVFVRDLQQLATIAVSLLLFLTPVLYPLSMVPEPWRAIIALNPLSLIIEAMRDALFAGRGPDAFSLLGLIAISFLVAQAGFMLFMRMRKAFADVL